MEFISIKDSVKIVGKSEATIKRMIKTVKEKSPENFSNENYFRFEKLPTGHTKTLINIQYLKDHFSNTATNSSMNHSNNSTSTAVSELPELYRDLFEVLKNELEVKNQQIQSLQERLRESNILALENTRKENPILLDEPKKRKWWHF